jgi:hypothetical protein
MNMTAEESVWFPNQDLTLVQLLLDIFEECFRAMAPEGEFHEEEMFGSPIDQACIPLLMVMKKLAQFKPARVMMRNMIMPADIDRTRPLTEGKTLSAAVIRSLSSILLSQTRDFVCELMIDLCDGDRMFRIHPRRTFCALRWVRQRRGLSLQPRDSAARRLQHQLLQRKNR